MDMGRLEKGTFAGNRTQGKKVPFQGRISSSIGRVSILVLDFGSQYNQLITRRVRECGVYCELVPYNIAVEEIKRINPKGIIFSGGPASVYQGNAPLCDPEIFELGIPILGICYGMQLMTYMLEGKVVKGRRREYGKTNLYLDESNVIFQDLEDRLTCWMSHGDLILEVPPGFKKLAHTDSAPIAAMGDPEHKLYALQFHPEVAHTPRGKEMLKNFLYHICECEASWSPHSFIQSAIGDIKERVGDGKVLCALSGGVDSATTAVLVHRAIGDQLTCIFVDTGLLRQGEAKQVVDTFKRNFHIDLRHIEAEERFLNRLEGVIDPEEKRKIIGEEFIRVFEEEARKLGNFFLAQGTLYPDVIESASAGIGPSARIKTHHNVGGLPEDLKLNLIEPLRFLFKDEVRGVAKSLNLPEEIVWRQPFPGPGLAIRILGEVTKERLDLLRSADKIVTDEIREAGLSKELWQFFAVLLPLKSVGVMGDERTYDQVIAVRAVSSDDAMTADWARLPSPLLERISNRITNEVSGINRVVYDITSKPPATIEWE